MRKILVIDDDYSVREALEAFLVQLGCEVVLAENGPRGLEAFEQTAFDGAIVDLVMPVMNGAEVCAILREKMTAAGRDFPIWVITSAPKHPLATEATKAGVRDILGKPAFWAPLRAALKQEFPSDEKPGQ